jgi:hypothetical protein
MADWLAFYSSSDNLQSLMPAGNSDGRLEVFAVDTALNVRHAWQNEPGSEWPAQWNGSWEPLYPAPATSITAVQPARNADGRLELFGLDPDGNVWHAWQTAPSNGWNGTWQTLYPDPSAYQSLTAARNADGSLQLFGIDANLNLWRTGQTAPSNGWSGSWEPLYSASDQLATLTLARNAGGRLEIFAIGVDGEVRHTWQTAANGGWNGSWELFYPGADGRTSLAVISNADGRLELFGIDGDAYVWHTGQTAPDNNWSGTWEPLYSPADTITAVAPARNADGRLEVLGLGTDGVARRTWQTAAGGDWNGSWDLLYSAADILASLTVIPNADGRLEALGLDYGGIPYRTWQAEPGGEWIGTFVPAPAPGLGSNSNYFLYSPVPSFTTPGCGSLELVSVSVNVTEEIVVQSSSQSTKGLSVQLNVWGPEEGPGFIWQQYIIALWGNDLIAAIDNFPPDSPDTAETWPFATVPGAPDRLPAGYTLVISLEADGQGRIATVAYQAWNEAGNPIGQLAKSVPLIAAYAANLGPGKALQVSIVGPVGGESSVLASGAGTIIYEAAPQLTVLDALPPCASSVVPGTAEAANTYYGQLQPGPASYLAQPFGVTRGRPLIKGPGITRPWSPPGG